MPERASVVVVGAGISGLTAAHQLARTGASIVVVDAADRAGGMVHTEHWRGFTIEHGPEGFLSTRPEALELIDDLGLAGDLVTGGPAPRRSFVLRRGRLQPLPQGVLQPTRTAARNLIASPLLSMRGRARLALEPVVGRNRSASDESVASFVRRRFGAELLDELVEPLVGGVHGAGTDELSANMILPALRGIERDGASIALRALRTPSPAARGGLPPLVSMRGGMGQLVDALAESLGDRLHLNAAVADLQQGGSGWRVVLTDGRTIDADTVIVATPPATSAKLLAPLDAELAALVDAQPMSRSQIVTLVWEPGDLGAGHPEPEGTGFLVPRNEGGHVAACTWVSAKWHHRAPAGGAIARLFLRPADGSFLPEEQAVDTARRVVAETLGLRAEPSRVIHAVWSAAIPVMHVGHRDRTERIAQLVDAAPGLALAGAGLEGGGLPACIRSGSLAAAALSRP